MTQDPPPLLPLDLLERYDPIRELGEGGYGRVVLARDGTLHRKVAVKVLSAALADEDARMRFDREARVTAELNHRHIVGLLDSGTTSSGDAYIVYEFVDGPNLGQLMAREGPLPAARIRALGAPLSEALAAAHAAGVLHRDLKPENVLLRGGKEPALCDFGVARRTRGRTVHTAEGIILGTITYMPPEFFLGEEPSPASDQFSLAATLLHAWTGVTVYDSEDPSEVVRKVNKGLRIELGPRAEEDPGLAAALEKALSPKPADRFEDLSALGRALREGSAERTKETRALGVSKLEPRSTTAPRPTSRPGPRPRWPAVLLGLAGLIGAAVWLAPSGSPPPVTSPAPVPEPPPELPEATELEEALRRLTGREPPEGPPPSSPVPRLYDPQLRDQIIRRLAKPDDFANRLDGLLRRLLRWLTALEKARRPGGPHPLTHAGNEDRLSRVIYYLYIIPHATQRRAFEGRTRTDDTTPLGAGDATLENLVHHMGFYTATERSVHEFLDGSRELEPVLPLLVARARLQSAYISLGLDPFQEELEEAMRAADVREPYARLPEVATLSLAIQYDDRRYTCPEGKPHWEELRTRLLAMAPYRPREWRAAEARRLLYLVDAMLARCRTAGLDELATVLPILLRAENSIPSGYTRPVVNVDSYLTTYATVEAIASAPPGRRRLLDGLEFLKGKWQALADESPALSAAFDPGSALPEWEAARDSLRQPLASDPGAGLPFLTELLPAASTWIEVCRLDAPKRLASPAGQDLLGDVGKAIEEALEASGADQPSAASWVRAFLWRAQSFDPDADPCVLAMVVWLGSLVDHPGVEHARERARGCP